MKQWKNKCHGERTDEAMEKLERPTKEVMQVLLDYGNPHLTIVITQTEAKIISDEIGYASAPPCD